MSAHIYLDPETQIMINDFRKHDPKFNLSSYVKEHLRRELLHSEDVNDLQKNINKLQEQQLALKNLIIDEEKKINKIQQSTLIEQQTMEQRQKDKVEAIETANKRELDRLRVTFPIHEESAIWGALMAWQSLSTQQRLSLDRYEFLSKHLNSQAPSL